MGVKQSKRSVDITETSTKGEIEGFGNEGKVEKIIDGVVEKVAANGHVDGELQNGIEPLQNGVEVIQNGEAAAVVVATEKMAEKKDADETPVEGQVVNGQVEVNGEAEKSEEGKKTDEKKEKKKEKKEKTVKKKFSLRNFSFSKKDKSKPVKEEKSAEKVNEAETEEVVTSPENEVTSTTQEQIETEKPEEPTKPVEETTAKEATVPPPMAAAEVQPPSPEKAVEASQKQAEDLPPPLPASPPPSEPVEGKLAAGADKLDPSQPATEKSSAEANEVASSLSNILTDEVETTKEAIQTADQMAMAMEAGKQIEEKATNLLKTVEERAGESKRAGAPEVPNAASSETKEEMKPDVDGEKVAEETVAGIPVDVSNVGGALSPKVEETTEKDEEGAGESLADMPKDLTDEATADAAAATGEPSTPDSLEMTGGLPPPPPVVEPLTGE